MAFRDDLVSCCDWLTIDGWVDVGFFDPVGQPPGVTSCCSHGSVNELTVSGCDMTGESAQYCPQCHDCALSMEALLGNNVWT